MKRHINVLVISHLYPQLKNPIKGIFVHNQVKTLVKKQNCNIIVVSPIPYCPKILTKFKKKWQEYYSVPQKSKIDDINIFYPKYLHLPGKNLFGLSSYLMAIGLRFSLGHILKRFKPDIIHAHTLIPDGYAVNLLKKYFKVPVVCTLHGSDINKYPYYNLITNKICRNAIKSTDQLITVSKCLENNVKKIAEPKKITTIYNGVDIKIFNKSSKYNKLLRKKLHIDNGSKIILFIGRIEINKGIIELISAFKKLNRFLKARLLIIGEKSNEKIVERTLIKNKSDKRIIILKRIENKMIPQYINMSSLLVLPSYHEGLPMVVCEAMSCGKPVIATKVGGILEVLKDNVNGLIVPAKDINALANAMEKIINNKALRIKMGKVARKQIKHKSNIEKNCRILKKLYEKLFN